MYKLQEAMLLRFPEYSKNIQDRIMEVEDCESLCHDYELCVEMILAIENEVHSTNLKLDEFLQIKKELESEALRLLL
jgi:hypothetical protein